MKRPEGFGVAVVLRILHIASPVDLGFCPALEFSGLKRGIFCVNYRVKIPLLAIISNRKNNKYHYFLAELGQITYLRTMSNVYTQRHAA